MVSRSLNKSLVAVVIVVIAVVMSVIGYYLGLSTAPSRVTTVTYYSTVTLTVTATPTTSPITPSPTKTSPTITTPTITPTITTPTVTTTPTTLTKITLRWATLQVGAAGYTGLALIADVINRNMPEVEIVVVPTASTAASVKTYCSGEADGCYSSTISFKELYTGTGRFAGFTPKRLPVQTFWAFTLEAAIAIHQRDLGKIKCWSDLKGKKIFPGPAGFDTRVALETALKLLNITYEAVELDTSMVADALERGTIVATLVYFTSGYGLPDWIRTLELSTPIAILNPCPEELEILKAKAPQLGLFTVVENLTRPKDVFVTDVKLTSGDMITGLRVFFGYHTGTEIPEEIVYKMLKVLEEHANELAQLNPMFKLLARDFVKFQVEGIETNRMIPIHPGLAKFLKEKGVWKSEWKIATQTPSSS